jgi:hypothetical protein
MKARALKRAVSSARGNPFFMGHALAQYETLHKIESDRLAEWLGCTSEAFAHLALCRKPNDTEDRFRNDVRRIAEYIDCEADKLVRLLRDVASISAFKEEIPPEEGGFLMAARDRRESKKNPNRGSSQNGLDQKDKG